MPSTEHPGYRIFFLGAGFSCPAGLPLAFELYPAVRAAIHRRSGTDTKFDRDVRNYLDYCNACGIEHQTEQSLNLELFMSHLDIEHYLGLRGSDTWSQEGNESQLMIRKAIGEVIHSHTPPGNRLPDQYYRFAECLSPNDTVFTLNYDLILERALIHVGRPFRRFPFRYKSVSRTGGPLESDEHAEEVVLMKLHGSLDWFDDRQFLEEKASIAALGTDGLPLHSVFDDPSRYDARPIVDGLLPEGDPLRHLHAIRRVDEYYERDNGFNAPFILSPSHVKFVYAEPLLGFWGGMGQSGGHNLGVSVVGFSLPEHDEYIRIGFYQLLSNYGSWWEAPMLGVLKDYARFVDFKSTPADVKAYHKRYRFVDHDRAQFYFGGFNDEAIDFLFHQRRETKPKR